MSQPTNTKNLNTTEPEFSQELFKPMPANAADAEKIGRPILTYWQDALKRLRRNKIAMISATVIALVGLSGVVGPFFFPSTPDGIPFENAQNPDFRNQEPNFGVQVLVTDDGWSAPAELIKENFNTTAALLKGDGILPPADLKLQSQATVNGVTLEWTPVEGVTGYQVYRTVVAPEQSDLTQVANDSDLRGMMVGTITNPAQYTFTDSAGLDPAETYVYALLSVVADPSTAEETLSPMASVVRVGLTKSMRLSDAINIDPAAQPGATIRARANLFGTDSLGRDILARTVQGTRIDFFLALVIPTISLLFGLVYGSVSGLAGGKVDLVLMRIIEILDTLPEILFLILFQVVLGKGTLSLIIALSAFSWTGYARILRGEVLRLREIEFVHASRLLGSSTRNLIFRHIAPNLLGIIIVLWSAHIPRIITSEAFLSILGLGLEAPAASWGTVLEEAGQRFQAHPLQFFLPASVMAVTLLAFFLLGDALRDAFDPKMRGRD